MRRYSVVILMMAIVTLATSCKLYDGESNLQPIDIGEAIASESHMQLAQTNFINRLVLMCDVYYATENEALRDKILEDHFTYYNYYLECNEDDATITIFDNFGNVARPFMIIYLEGGLLSEGGVWSVDEGYTATYTTTESGIEVNIDFSENFYYGGKSNFVISNVEYDVENDLTYNLAGSMELLFNAYGAETLSTTITQVLSYSNKLYHNGNDYRCRYVGFHDGAMNAQYVDAEHRIYDVRMTYKGSENIAVEYCGERSVITNFTYK